MTPSSPNVRGLYAIIDSSCVAPGRMEEVALAILKTGVRIIQLRAKGMASKETLKAARALSGLSRGFGAKFIVNDFIDIAVISGADGVHLGQNDIPLEDARRLLGQTAMIGISTHNAEEALRAEKNGADYISFGPVFPTKTKKDAEEPKGLSGLKEVNGCVSLPIAAIGGITEENMEAVFRAGADAVAMISEVLLSEDISLKTASIVSRIRGL